MFKTLIPIVLHNGAQQGSILNPHPVGYVLVDLLKVSDNGH